MSGQRDCWGTRDRWSPSYKSHWNVCLLQGLGLAADIGVKVEIYVKAKGWGELHDISVGILAPRIDIYATLNCLIVCRITIIAYTCYNCSFSLRDS